MDDRSMAAHAPDRRFDTLGGAAALAAAVVSLVYAVAFVVLKSDLLASIALMAGGLLSAMALFAVYLGLVLGVVLIVIYLGRLIVLDAANMLVLGPALVGAILSPIWYGWLGYLLLTGRADST